MRSGPSSPRQRRTAKIPPPGLIYAAVEKTRKKGRVVEIAARLVFGTITAVMAALGISLASTAIDTSFVERRNATDRHRNARKTYRFK